MGKEFKNIPLSEIRVTGERRSLDKKKLRAITDSMAEIGLKTPITVRAKKNGLVLVAGYHRLEAAKSLHWKRIEAFVSDTNKFDANLWTIAENLHRSELTALERSNFLRKWEQLLKERAKGVEVAHPGGRQPHDRGVSKTAKALGVTRGQVQRSRKIASISPEAKSAAKRGGLEDNAAALLKVAKAKSAKEQVKKVRELADNKKTQRRKLDRSDHRRLNNLKREFKAASAFKDAWDDASAIVRKKFVCNVLLRSGGN